MSDAYAALVAAFVDALHPGFSYYNSFEADCAAFKKRGLTAKQAAVRVLDCEHLGVGRADKRWAVIGQSGAGYCEAGNSSTIYATRTSAAEAAPEGWICDTRAEAESLALYADER